MKNSRRQAIIDIINTFNISTQEELTAKLVEKGFNVSQATISRDIKELNLIKVEQKYAVIEDFSQKLSSKLVNLFKQITISIESANNLIVLKTISGNASAAGMAIDELKFPQILGTVAGDDTLLIITKTSADAEMVVKGLEKL
ncbi:MAG: arginine repressor [Clostridiales bacterium]|nr:arginine repressor [Clostridiales bacterium]